MNVVALILPSISDQPPATETTTDSGWMMEADSGWIMSSLSQIGHEG